MRNICVFAASEEIKVPVVQLMGRKMKNFGDVLTQVAVPARLKAERILCGKPRCPEHFLDVIEITGEDGHFDHEGNFHTWGESLGMALQLLPGFEKDKNGVYRLSKRPACRQESNQQERKSFAFIGSHPLHQHKTHLKRLKSERDTAGVVVGGADPHGNLDTVSDEVDDVLPIIVRCSRCNTLSCVSSETLDQTLPVRHL